MRFIKFIFFFIIITFSNQVNSSDYFLMLKKSKVNVRYGPSFENDIKYIYKKKFLPVKVIDKKENFRKIIDHKKNSGWIHISQLKKPNSLILLEDKLLFKKNTKFSEPLVIIKKGKIVLIKKCNSEWCKVILNNHKGWILNDNVWGALK